MYPFRPPYHTLLSNDTQRRQSGSQTPGNFIYTINPVGPVNRLAIDSGYVMENKTFIKMIAMNFK